MTIYINSRNKSYDLIINGVCVDNYKYYEDAKSDRDLIVKRHECNGTFEDVLSAEIAKLLFE